MSDSSNKPSRRRLLLAAGLVSALPQQNWVKPVVTSTVLPAHAGTTDMEPDQQEGETTLSPDEIVDNVIRPILLKKSPHR